MKTLLTGGSGFIGSNLTQRIHGTQHCDLKTVSRFQLQECFNHPFEIIDSKKNEPKRASVFCLPPRLIFVLLLLFFALAFFCRFQVLNEKKGPARQNVAVGHRRAARVARGVQRDKLGAELRGALAHRRGRVQAHESCSPR